MKQILTLYMVYDNKRILLGMKKRGFGQGRWNGFGGKIEVDESIETAAFRELKEEVGLEVKNIDKRAVLTFKFQGESDELEVHVFSVIEWQGEPKETEEMRPQWFLLGNIPYKDMWPDDKLWLLLFLQGKKLEAQFYFQDKNKLLDYKLKTV